MLVTLHAHLQVTWLAAALQFAVVPPLVAALLLAAARSPAAAPPPLVEVQFTADRPLQVQGLPTPGQIPPAPGAHPPIAALAAASPHVAQDIQVGLHLQDLPHPVQATEAVIQVEEAPAATLGIHLPGAAAIPAVPAHQADIPEAPVHQAVPIPIQVAAAHHTGSL